MAIKISTKHLWCLTHSVHSVYLLNVWIYEWLNDGHLNTNSDHGNWWASLIKNTTVSLKCMYVCVACMYVNGLQYCDSVSGDIHFLNNSCLTLQFSSVVSNSLQPHESQHASPPCPSPTPRVHSNSHPSSQWCHPAISSSVIPFSSCPQSLPASESFPMSQLFTSGGQSTGVSALASFLPKNTQDWSPSEWTGWISLQSKGLSGVFSNTTVQKHQFFGAQLSSQSNSHIHTWPLEKP